jgi:hypothetical protein
MGDQLIVRPSNKINQAKHCRRMVITPSSYSGSLFQISARISRLMFLVVFLTPSMQMLGQYLTFGRDHFHAISNSLLTKHRTVGRKQWGLLKAPFNGYVG